MLRKSIVVVQVLVLVTTFARAAYTDECLVTRAIDDTAEGSIRWALSQAKNGGCTTDDADYRRRYENIFPGLVSFRVIHWDRSMEIYLGSSVPEIQSTRDHPIVLVADDDADVRIIGAGSDPQGITLSGSRATIDHLTIKGFGGIGITMKGEEGLVIHSRILEHARDGIDITGLHNRVEDTEVSGNIQNGMVIRRPTGWTCPTTSTSFEKPTLVVKSDIHDNHVAGIVVHTFPNTGSGCYLHSLRNATVTETTMVDNAVNLLVNPYPFPTVSSLAVSRGQAGEITVSGIIRLSAASADQPWNQETVNVHSLHVEVYLADEHGGGKKFIASTDEIDPENGNRFKVTWSTTTNTTTDHYVATVTDTEYGVTSPFSSSDSSGGTTGDADGDGLSDEREDANGNGRVDRDQGETDPLNPDTDADGLTDGAERENGRLDPNNPDSDGDGLLDGLEILTDPTQADTDNDDLNDGEEGTLGTDPTIPDSDSDGLLDGDEVHVKGSDPLQPDTDGDGALDGDEVRMDTDVKGCDTDGDGLSDGVEMGAIGGKIGGTDVCHGLTPAGTNYHHANMLSPTSPDSDGDGLLDGQEDHDGNGWIDGDESDPSLEDSDGDGLSDGTEATGDFDGDGFPDFDVRNVVGEQGCHPPSALSDIDCDGVPNQRDNDSDNDGCADRDEGGWKDVNKNDIPDVYDSQVKSCDVSGGGGSIAGAISGQGGHEESPQEESPPVSSISLRHLATAGGACSLMTTSSDDLSSGILLVLISLLGLLLAKARFCVIRRS